MTPVNIVIMGDRFGFPFGTGASSRVAAYAKGLQAAGARVHVLCVEPSDDEAAPLNRVAHGRYEGVEFTYTYGRTSRPRGRVRRAVLKLMKWPRFALHAWGWSREHGGLDAVLAYSFSLRWLVAAALLCRVTGAVCLHEVCELPFYWEKKRIVIVVRRWLYYHVIFKAFDGCLVISTYLEKLCRQYLGPGCRTLLVPVLIDGTAPIPRVEPGNAVVYCGSLDHPEVLGLLDIFARVADTFPDVRLKLVGDAKRAASREGLRRRAASLGIGDRVDYTGHVTRDQLPALLAGARALVLPRPSGAFSQAGLPTKVADYLCAGRPVVVSANGDLPRYLTDGEDAYLAPPDDAAAFADRLRHVLSEPEQGSAVGARGRETALRKFDAAVHGARVVQFVRELHELRGETPTGAATGRR